MIEIIKHSGLRGRGGGGFPTATGKIKNTGLVEVAMGTSLRKVIFDIGSGAVNGGRIKAVQTGGPSGGCLPVSAFDLPVDFDALFEAGSMIGSGGVVVMDDSSCMVDVAKYFLAFLQDESCGKCVPCRLGIDRMLEIVTDITEGRGRPEQIPLLEELADTVAQTSLCGRCVRVFCTEVWKARAIGFVGRGKDRRVGHPFGVRPDFCKQCGNRIQLCPMTITPCDGPMKPGKEYLCGKCESQLYLADQTPDSCVWCKLGEGFGCGRYV